MNRVSASALPWLGLVLLLVPLALGNDYVLHMLCLWVLYSLLALSLNIVVGFLGELTFWSRGFFLVSAPTPRPCW